MERTDFVASFARGLEVLRAFDAAHPTRSVREVAVATGLHRAAARRLLLTLVELGYATAEDGRFRLTARVLDLGYAYLSALSLPERAAPHLVALSAQVGESASMSVLDGGDIVYVGRAPARTILALSITVGTRLPAATTSMGRVLLAGLAPAQLDALGLPDRVPAGGAADLRTVLAQVRDQGHCLVDGELDPALRSVAVPVRDRTSSVVAAVNVSTTRSRESPQETLARVLPALRECARRIEGDLPPGP